MRSPILRSDRTPSESPGRWSADLSAQGGPARGLYLGDGAPQVPWGFGGFAPEKMHRASAWREKGLLDYLPTLSRGPGVW